LIWYIYKEAASSKNEYDILNAHHQGPCTKAQYTEAKRNITTVVPLKKTPQWHPWYLKISNSGTGRVAKAAREGSGHDVGS
jgi:hypothetical protein